MNMIYIIISVFALVLLLCFCLSIASFAYEKFYDKLMELSEIKVEGSDITAYQFVQLINNTKFSSCLEIIPIAGKTGDAYGGGKLYLSQNTLQSNSIASFTVISHELGHAMQDKEGRKLKRLNLFRKLIRFLGILFWPLVIVGIIMFVLVEELNLVGIILLSISLLSIFLALILKIVMISIEKDASKKAIRLLKEILSEKELREAKKLLNSAKLTYWADFFRAIFGWTMLTRKGNLFK